MKVFVFPLLYDNIATTLEATHLLSQILRGQESGHGLAGSPAQGLMNLHSRRWPRCPCHLELRVLFQACSDRWKTSLLAAAGLRCPCFSARCWMTSLPCGSQGQSTAQMFAFVWASWSESADFFFFISFKSSFHQVKLTEDNFHFEIYQSTGQSPNRKSEIPSQSLFHPLIACRLYHVVGHWGSLRILSVLGNIS